MPDITKQLRIDIPPERFLAACSDVELYEVYLLLQGAEYQQRIEAIQAGEEAINYLKEDLNARNR